MSIYLLRHGQTDWNAQGIVQGRFDVPLNEKGKEQARAAGEKLKDVPLAVCYVSPLSRAKETAKLALKGKDVPVIEDNRLVEMAFGIYEGTDWRSKTYQHLRRQLSNRFETGESYFDVAHRAYSFLDEIAPKSLDCNILIVCHGGIGRVIRSYFINESDNESFIDNICANGGMEVYDYVPRSVPPVMPLPKK